MRKEVSRYCLRWKIGITFAILEDIRNVNRFGLSGAGIMTLPLV